MKILNADAGNISFMYNRHSNPKLGNDSIVTIPYTERFIKFLKNEDELPYYKLSLTLATMLNDMIKHNDKGAGKFLPYNTTKFIDGINATKDSVDITFNLNESNRNKLTKDEFENSVKTVIAYIAQLLDTSDIY